MNLLQKLFGTNDTLSASRNTVSETLRIPEPTKSLLWITDEEASKISSPVSIKITIDLNTKNVYSTDESYNFYSEPSLIWTKLPVEINSEIESNKMYYPSYSGLLPKHRYQYLSWLRDITQKTNLSYVFLYFYGLERHLLVGKYEEAVEEILRLLKHHNEGSFKSYAINSLISASGFRKRVDILQKAPFLLDQSSNESLLLCRSAGKSINSNQIIELASRVTFTNKRYIKEQPELFKKELEKILITYEKTNGNILRNINIDRLEKKPYPIIANISVPSKFRTWKLPQIIEDENFRMALKHILSETHQTIKKMTKNSPGRKLTQH